MEDKKKNKKSESSLIFVLTLIYESAIMYIVNERDNTNKGEQKDEI